MANNTLHAEWIILIYNNLMALLAGEDVFVATDLFWYPVEGDNQTRFAPDVMVVFGRPHGHRGSYRQWEEAGVAPQVVFEILSPSNTQREMRDKLAFYDRYGVQEYILLHPEKGYVELYTRSGDKLVLTSQGQPSWQSPLMGIQIAVADKQVQISGPDGRAFVSLREERAAKEEALAKARKLEALLREMGVNPDQEL